MLGELASVTLLLEKKNKQVMQEPGTMIYDKTKINSNPICTLEYKQTKGYKRRQILINVSVS